MAKPLLCRLQPRIGGNHHLRIALRSGAKLGLAQNAVAGGGGQLAAQLVDFEGGRVVLRLGRLAVGLASGVVTMPCAVSKSASRCSS